MSGREHVIMVRTGNPAARTLLATWAGYVARAPWDSDPATGQTYDVHVDAFTLDAADGAAPVELDLTAKPGAVPAGVAAFLDTLAGVLTDTAADARCGLVDPAAVMESVARDLARLAQAPAPAPRAVRPRRVTQ